MCYRDLPETVEWGALWQGHWAAEDPRQLVWRVNEFGQLENRLEKRPATPAGSSGR